MSIQIRWLASCGMASGTGVKWTRPFSHAATRFSPVTAAAVHHFVFVASHWPRSLAVRLWLAVAPDRASSRAHRDSVPAAFAVAHRHRGPSQGRRLHGRQAAAGDAAHASSDAVLLLAMTLGGGLAAIIGWTETLAIGPLWRDVAMFAVAGADLRHRQPAVLVVAHVPHRGALRLQPHDDGAVARRPRQGPRARRRARPAAAGAGAVADARRRARCGGCGHGARGWPSSCSMLVLYPTVIAPLFNKFTPMDDNPARERIEALLARCGFRSAGLFVMDGSKRSGHGNAYFTGFGKAKRIVFFDTLLVRLAPEEIEAVLAHELGHFKLRHVVKRIAVVGACCRSRSSRCSRGSRRRPGSTRASAFRRRCCRSRSRVPASRSSSSCWRCRCSRSCWSRLSSLYSRRHEFEADAFATRHASAAALTVALVKLYEDNAATLTPDPLHSAFYDSHPPAAVRIARIEALRRGAMPLAARRVNAHVAAAAHALVACRRSRSSRRHSATATPRPASARRARLRRLPRAADSARDGDLHARRPPRAARRRSCSRRCSVCNVELGRLFPRRGGTRGRLSQPAPTTSSNHDRSRT